MKGRFILISGFLIIIHFSAFSQSANPSVVTQPIEWFAVGAHVKVNRNLAVMAEGQFRFADAFDPMQFQIRTGIEAKINKHLSIVPIGYVYTWNPIYGKIPSEFVNNEHRLWEQINVKHKLGRVEAGHRFRLEQRHFQVHSRVNGEVIDEGYTLYTNRLRYKFTVSFPLNETTVGKGALSFTAYEEIFLSFGRNVHYHHPDQNRLFAGLSYKLSERLTFQGGPFYQIIIKSAGTRQENNIGAQLQLLYDLDVTKK